MCSRENQIAARQVFRDSTKLPYPISMDTASSSSNIIETNAHKILKRERMFVAAGPVLSLALA